MPVCSFLMELNGVRITPIATFVRVPCSHLHSKKKGVKGELEEEKEIERTYKGKARRYENGSGKEESWGYL